MYAKKNLFENEIFWKRIIKKAEKNLVPFYRKDYKQKKSGANYQSFFGF